MLYPTSDDLLNLNDSELDFDIVKIAGVCAMFISSYDSVSTLPDDEQTAVLEKYNVNIYKYGEYNKGTDILLTDQDYFFHLDYIPGSIVTIIAKKGSWTGSKVTKNLRFQSFEEFTLTFMVKDSGLDLSGGYWEKGDEYTTYIDSLPEESRNLVTTFTQLMGNRVGEYLASLQ